MPKSLRVACIGCGGNARVHMQRLAQIEDVRIVGLVDPAKAAIAAARTRVPALVDAPAFADHRPMLEQLQPDAVVVSTPHTQHAAQVIDSLRTGAHVLCEKPLACSTADTRRIIRQADRAGRHVVLAFQRRFSGLWRFIRDRVRDRAFGRPMFVSSFLSQGWLSLVRGTWRQKLALSGGGQLNDSGAHLIDMIFWALPDRPVQVSAHIDNRRTEVDIDSTIAFRCAGGTLGSLAVLGSGPRPVFWEDVTISSDAGRAIFLRNGTLTMVDGDSVAEVKRFAPDSTPDEHFVQVVRGQASNQAPPADFLPNIAFTEACWRSARQGGRPVKVRYSN